MVNVPSGCTSCAQSLGVFLKSHSKLLLDTALWEHLEENLQRYTEGELNDPERRVLSTNWVGNALAEIGYTRDMVFHRFKTCSISLPLYGSEN